MRLPRVRFTVRQLMVAVAVVAVVTGATVVERRSWRGQSGAAGPPQGDRRVHREGLGVDS